MRNSLIINRKKLFNKLFHSLLHTEMVDCYALKKRNNCLIWLTCCMPSKRGVHFGPPLICRPYFFNTKTLRYKGTQ